MDPLSLYLGIGNYLEMKQVHVNLNEDRIGWY
jgi:hypothetical protein